MSEAEDADGLSMEPPIYSSTGLDHTLVNVSTPWKSGGEVSRVLPTTQPTIQSLVMYRLFRAGLGLTTLVTSASTPQPTPVDDHVPTSETDSSEAASANEQLQLLLEECMDLLHRSIAASRRGPDNGGWVVDWTAGTQKRLAQFDSWGSETVNWADIPWRRSALGFLLQFFTPSTEASGTGDGQTDARLEVAAQPRWLAAVTRQVESFDTALHSIAEEGEDLSLPRRWVPRGLPRRGVHAAAHRWWFQTADEAVLAAGFLWGNRC